MGQPLFDELTIPFSQPQLVVCTAAESRQTREKIKQALEGRVSSVFETHDMTTLMGLINGFEARVIFLGFRFYMMAYQPEMIASLPADQRPKVILTGTQGQLDQPIRAKAVDSLLAQPFLPEMLLLKINSVLSPGTCWQKAEELVLAKMRKYQRFEVEGVNVHFHKPIVEKTEVLDISYQGLKARTRVFTAANLGAEVTMQITVGGVYTLIRGRLLWLRDGMAGLRFTNHRPDNFENFFKQVLDHAVGFD